MSTLREEVYDPLTTLRGELLRVAIRDRWDRLFLAIAWVQLVGAVVSYWLNGRTWHQNWQHVVLWCFECVIVLGLLRWLAGPRWFTRTPLAGVLMRVWVTFFLVAFGAASMNARTGFEMDWFKLSWASLSSFAWATTAAMLGWRFLIPAFQMYFTGLLISRFPHYGYLIFGGSWFVALHGLGFWLSTRRAAHAAPSASASSRREFRSVHHLRA